MTKISASVQSQSEYCTGCGICLTPQAPNMWSARTPTGLRCKDCYRSYYGTLAYEKKVWVEQYEALMGTLPPLLQLMVEKRLSPGKPLKASVQGGNRVKGA